MRNFFKRRPRPRQEVNLHLRQDMTDTPYQIHHKIDVVHKYLPKPRPIRMVIVWCMPDGLEYKTYIPIHGQSSYHEQMPRFIETAICEGASITLRYDLQYEDGGII